MNPLYDFDLGNWTMCSITIYEYGININVMFWTGFQALGQFCWLSINVTFDTDAIIWP